MILYYNLSFIDFKQAQTGQNQNGQLFHAKQSIKK